MASEQSSRSLPKNPAGTKKENEGKEETIYVSYYDANYQRGIEMWTSRLLDWHSTNWAIDSAPLAFQPGSS